LATPALKPAASSGWHGLAIFLAQHHVPSRIKRAHLDGVPVAIGRLRAVSIGWSDAEMVEEPTTLPSRCRKRPATAARYYGSG